MRNVNTQTCKDRQRKLIFFFFFLAGQQSFSFFLAKNKTTTPLQKKKEIANNSASETHTQTQCDKANLNTFHLIQKFTIGYARIQTTTIAHSFVCVSISVVFIVSKMQKKKRRR